MDEFLLWFLGLGALIFCIFAVMKMSLGRSGSKEKEDKCARK